MYLEKRIATSRFVPIRGLGYHLLQWPAPDAGLENKLQPLPPLPPLLLLHGWMDVGASWQFMVDSLAPAFIAGRSIIALDWRGFGQTGPIPAGQDCFWFADYLADLDFLIDHLAEEFSTSQVDLIGHSMGGNIAMLYGGIRPERIRRLINLEGFGLKAGHAEQAPERYASWMDSLRKVHSGELDLKSYASADGVARRLMKTNPRLSQDKAAWLARRWAQQDVQTGQWHVQGHPAHKAGSAQVYRLEEVLAIYQRITAPVLSVQSSGDSLAVWWKGGYTLADYFERLKQVPHVQTATLPDTGHMLHHDQPEALAQLVAAFLTPDLP